MSIEQNKKVVKAFFEAFAAADVAGAIPLLNDSVTWRNMGQVGGPPMCQEIDKAGIAELIVGIKGVLPEGIKMTPTGWTAEGDRVAVEIESYGEKADGTVYNNLYHFLVTLADGKISHIKEYMDTLHVKQVFVGD